MDGKFASVWFGVTFSTVGSRAIGVTYPLLALALTGSPAHAGWTGFALTLPVLVFYLPAGVLADRVDPRSLMLFTEPLRGLTVLSVFIALLFHRLSLPHLLSAALLEGMLWVVYSLAETALVSSMATGSETSGAIAKSETIAHVAVLTGRPLGGWLFGVTQAAPFFLNSVFFSLSMFFSLRVASGRGGDPGLPVVRQMISGLHGMTSRRMVDETASGLRELLKHSFLRRAMALTTLTNLVLNALIMVFITGTGLSSHQVGLALATGGLGGVLGSSLALYLRLEPGNRILFAHLCVWTLAVSIAACGGGAFFFGLAILLTGCAGAIGNVAIRTFEADKVDRSLLGRVVSVHRLVVYGAVCVAAPFGGILVSVFGDRTAAFILAGLIWLATLVVSIRALFSRCARLPLPTWPYPPMWPGLTWLRLAARLGLLSRRPAISSLSSMWRAPAGAVTEPLRRRRRAADPLR